MPLSRIAGVAVAVLSARRSRPARVEWLASALSLVLFFRAFAIRQSEELGTGGGGGRVVKGGGRGGGGKAHAAPGRNHQKAFLFLFGPPGCRRADHVCG